jgi:hypothetical protein
VAPAPTRVNRWIPDLDALDIAEPIDPSEEDPILKGLHPSVRCGDGLV